MRPRKFDINIVRNADFLRGWQPSATEITGDHLAGNLSYSEISGVGWDDVAEALQFEMEMMVELVALSPEETREDDILDFQVQFGGLDLGIVSATFALSVMGAYLSLAAMGGHLGRRHTTSFIRWSRSTASQSRRRPCWRSQRLQDSDWRTAIWAYSY